LAQVGEKAGLNRRPARAGAEKDKNTPARIVNRLGLSYAFVGETDKAARDNAKSKRDERIMGRRDDFFQTLEALTPTLRRYARALFAGAGLAAADDLVQTALQLVALQIRAKQFRPRDANAARLRAYEVLTDLAGRKMREGATTRPSSRYPAVVHGLSELPHDERATLLLVALEGLAYDDAARILGVTRDVTLARLTRARAALAGLDLRPPAPAEGTRRATGHLRVVK